MSRPLPPIGPARVLPPIPVHAEVLANGLAVTVVERRDLPMVDLEVIVRGGGALDTAATAGHASMLAELLDEGTPSRAALEIAEQLEHLGAYFDVHAGWDSTTVSLQLLSVRLGPALDILADVVLNAAFPADEFRRKQRERLTALRQERAEPAILAAKALAAGVFGDAHPFGVPPAGTYQSIERLTNEQVAALYRSRFNAAHTQVLVVGDVDADAMSAAVAGHFGAWHADASNGAVTLAPPRTNGTRVLLVDKPGAAQAELRVGHHGPARNTDDFFALVVLNTLLGGSFTSRLNTILRERMGVTYGANSRFRLRRHGGVFTAGAAILTDAAPRGAQVVLEEMERLQAEPVGPEELRRAQSYIALGLPRSFETTEEIAAHIREQLVYGLEADYWQTYVDRVFDVTPDDIAHAAARHLHPDASTIVVVADKRDVQGGLERSGLGEVVLTKVAT
ncbi:MAG: M16 family metallopeptidase [Gemmatimonadota bacterium]